MLIKQCNGSIFVLENCIEEKINNFIILVKKWNGLNLIAKSTVQDIWNLHILEGLSLECLLDKNFKIVDFGAGGGVIGVPLYYLNYDVLCVERSQTKGFFLNQIVKVPTFIGENFALNEPFYAIVRGVEKIKVLLDLLGKNLKVAILLKSNLYKSEIIQAQTAYSFKYEIFPRLNINGKVIVLYDIKKK